MKSRCHSLLRFVYNERFFSVPFLLMIGLIGYFSLITEKTGLHLYVNQWVGRADYFFSVITILGDGITASLLVLGLLFFNINIAVRSLYAFLISTVIVWICKFLIFTEAQRPKLVFEQLNITLHTVPGVEIYGSHSFPSGHATTIFAILTCIAYNYKHHAVKFILFFIAAATAFSRVYLSQHFLEDMLFGSIIGVLSAMLVLHTHENTCFTWHRKKLITRFRLT